MAPTGVGGSQTLTEKRRPSTSTGTSRDSSGTESPSVPATGAGGVGCTRLVRSAGSTSSSSQRVEWRPATKSGWASSMAWAGSVDGTPPISNSATARRARAMATSRVGPQTTSLAIRLS